jgi:protein O-mannosyl-transferase
MSQPGRTTPPWGRRDALWIAGLVVVVAAVHARALAGGFLDWDDNRFITANPLFHQGGWAYVRAALTRVQFEAYQPLHLLSYLPDRALWPDAAAGFHAVDLALYAGDVALAYALVRRHAGSAAAAAACLLVALHPLTVEPVSWITSRKDVLALAFFLGALLVEDRRGAVRARPAVLGVALGAAAMLSKSATVCLPLVVAAWLRWVGGARARVAIVRALPYAVLAAAAALAVALLWHGHHMIAHRPAAAPVDVAASFALYAVRIAVPVGLSPAYPAAAPAAILLAAGAALAAVALALTWRRLPAAARYAAAAFVAALLPVANLVPIQFRFADRYALLALFALILPIAVALDRAPRLRAAAVAALVAVAAVEATATWRLTGAWHDSAALWARAARAQPASRLAHFKRGEVLRDAGDWPGAVAEYQAAIRLDPDRPDGYAGLLYVYARRAEAAGRLPAGTGDRWLAGLGPAMASPQAFGRFLDEVPYDACPPCANLALAIGLRRWAPRDPILVDDARQALERGRPDVALVYLASVHDRATPGFGDLVRRASAAARGGAPKR